MAQYSNRTLFGLQSLNRGNICRSAFKPKQRHQVKFLQKNFLIYIYLSGQILIRLLAPWLGPSSHSRIEKYHQFYSSHVSSNLLENSFFKSSSTILFNADFLKLSMISLWKEHYVCHFWEIIRNFYFMVHFILPSPSFFILFYQQVIIFPSPRWVGKFLMYAALNKIHFYRRRFIIFRRLLVTALQG